MDLQQILSFTPTHSFNKRTAFSAFAARISPLFAKYGKVSEIWLQYKNIRSETVVEYLTITFVVLLGDVAGKTIEIRFS